MYKTGYVGVFLLAGLLFLGISVLTAEAGISLDAVNYEIELSGGVFDLDLIWDLPIVNNTHLVNETGGVWLLNWSIVVANDAILVIDPVTGNASAVHCTWLKMNSTNASGKFESHIYVQGSLYVNDTMITGWNYTGDCNQTWNGTSCTFRPYIYILPTSHTDTPWASFLNSTIGYLGYDIDNKYGIVYEDDTLESTDIDSQGWMHNCTVMENFIGIDFQGCENMNVTNTWMNNTHDAGIVYTVGGVTGNGSHGGFIGDHPTWTHRATYTSVAVDYCNGTLDAMGIRLYGSDNITMNEVNIQDAYTEGLHVDTCDNVTASNVTCYLNTNAGDDYNICLDTVTNSTFNNCTAYSPDGDADGGNWLITTGSNDNVLQDCNAWGSTAHEDFYNYNSLRNDYIRCTANNSNIGFEIHLGNNNSCVNCKAHNHTLYNYKILGSQYNIIDNGFANTSTIGVYIIDVYDSDISYNNTVLNIEINSETSYAISIGSDGAANNICHNNTVSDVTVTGTTTGDGIFLFDNVTYNHIMSSTVTDLSLAASGGMGATNHAINNTFDNCSVYSNGGIGYYLLGNSSYNRFYLCNSSNNLYGMLMSEYTNNNTVHYGDFNNNTWTGIWVTADASSNGGNTFWYSTSNDNFYGIYLQNTPSVRFTEVDAYDSTCYGVVVIDNASAYLFNCISYNSSITWHDWYVDNASEADIYTPYILGYDKNINFQFDTTQPYGLCAHDPGDGIWGLNTTMMTVYCNDGKDVWVNLTDWTGTTYRKWYVTGVAGDYIYQKIGGLTAGILYQRKVSGANSGTYHGATDTMLGTSTGIVWFNYTSGWSTLYFELTPYEGPDNGGSGGGSGSGNGDDDDATPTISDISAILESPWFWLLTGVIALVLLLLLLDWLLGWFGFLALLGLEKKKRR